MSTVRVVVNKFTEVFEGQFVDHVRFESERQVFDLVLVEGQWLVRVVDGWTPKLPSHVNLRHGGPTDNSPTESTEDIPF